VADGRPDPERDDVSTSVDVLEGSSRPSWWRRSWTALPRATRLLIAALVLLLLSGAVVVRSAERARALQVDLATSLGIWSSSTSRAGGEVSFFVLVRNEGDRPLTVTSLDGTGDGLLLRMRNAGDRELPAGVEIDIPLSVLLTCGADASGDPPVTAELGIRRADGGVTSRQVDLEPAGLVLDVARTLCSVRPDLRDHELSGPVLRPRQAPDLGEECESGSRGGRTG
jgi:hypothetical protein